MAAKAGRQKDHGFGRLDRRAGRPKGCSVQALNLVVVGSICTTAKRLKDQLINKKKRKLEIEGPYLLFFHSLFFTENDTLVFSAKPFTCQNGFFLFVCVIRISFQICREVSNFARFLHTESTLMSLINVGLRLFFLRKYFRPYAVIPDPTFIYF